MGLKDIIEKNKPVVIQWDDTRANINDMVVYRADVENFKALSRIIVQESQEAIFAHEGNFADTFGPGPHVPDNANTPIMSGLIQKGYSKDSPAAIPCKVYFVNKVHMQNLLWGSRGEIEVHDYKLDAKIHLKANGRFAASIADSRKFLIDVIGTRATFSKVDLEEYLVGKLVQSVKALLAQTIVSRGISYYEIQALMNDLGDEMLKQLQPKFAQFGIALEDFYFESISLREDDEKFFSELDKKRIAMDTESAAMARKRAREGYTYSQEKGMDVLKTAAQNEGTAGTLMGATMGLGMGFGIGGAFNQGMSNVANATMNPANQASPAPAATCPHCNNPVAPGAKFCPNCGNKIGNTCPKCGNAVAPGAKFCPNCGTSLAKVCPSCGKEAGEGKFCQNCGQKLD